MVCHPPARIGGAKVHSNVQTSDTSKFLRHLILPVLETSVRLDKSVRSVKLGIVGGWEGAMKIEALLGYRKTDLCARIQPKAIRPRGNGGGAVEVTSYEYASHKPVNPGLESGYTRTGRNLFAKARYLVAGQKGRIEGSVAHQVAGSMLAGCHWSRKSGCWRVVPNQSVGPITYLGM